MRYKNALRRTLIRTQIKTLIQTLIFFRTQKNKCEINVIFVEINVYSQS